jgi:hypothetical protein
VHFLQPTEKIMNVKHLVSTLLLLGTVTFGSSIAAQEGKGKQNQLVGLWQLESLYAELKDGKKIRNFGEKPRGYIYFSPGGHAVSHFTATDRPKPKTEADTVAAFKTLYSLGGTYKVKGNTYTLMPETAHNENMVGSELKRDFKVEGNKLTVITAWAPASFLDGNPPARAVSVWKRVK